MLRNRNSILTKDLTTKSQRLVASALLVSQLLTHGLAEDPSSYSRGSSWQPRPNTTITQTSTRDAEWGWSEAASPSASQDIKWVATGTLPASPWQRPVASLPFVSNNPNPGPVVDAGRSTSSANFPARPGTDNMIRQPSQSQSVRGTNVPLAGARRADQTAQGLDHAAPTNAAWPSVPGFTMVGQATAIADATQNVSDATLSSTYAEQSRVYEAMVHASRVLNEPEAPIQPEYHSNAPSNVVGLIAGIDASQPSSVIPSTQTQPVFIPTETSPNQHVEHASMPEIEALEAKNRLASRVSTELLQDSLEPLQESPLPIEYPTGWKSIEDDLQKRLSRCEELLRRNAVMSAREEVLAGIRTLLRAIDLRTGVWAGEPAFDQALTAFSEEVDFHRSLSTPDRSASTTSIVGRHTTPVLKNTDLRKVSPELAAQHYRSFARQQLATAAQRHPWAADLYYALGKTLERQAELGKENGVMYRNQAVVCYEATLMINANHAGGTSQLGYTLLKLDRVQEAHDAIHRSLQIQPSVESWRNLAEVYRRCGQTQQVSYAESQVVALASAQSNPKMPEVNYLEPQVFAEISPNHFVGHAPGVAAVAPAGTPKSPVTSSTSWWGRLWR